MKLGNLLCVQFMQKNYFLRWKDVIKVNYIIYLNLLYQMVIVIFKILVMLLYFDLIFKDFDGVEEKI